RQAGIHFTPKQLFQHQTVQGLAVVARVGEQGGVQIDQGPVTGQALLLPIQQWFFEQDIPDRHHWNQSLLLTPGQRLEASVLEQALQALVAHHDALRLGFAQQDDGRWEAAYRTAGPAAPLLWQVELEGEQALPGLCENAQASLDLAQGPLLRAVLANLPDGSQRLLLAVHHLVVDGVSWRILLQDLQTAHGQLSTGQAVALAAKTSAGKAWAERIQGYANGDAQAELSLWREQLAGASSLLPCDNAQGSLQNRHAERAQTRLGADLTRKLLQQAPTAYRTQVNDLLLTALARVIARWTADEQVHIQLEGHGREDLFEDVDLTRTVGWFTSLYPVKLTVRPSVAESIKRVKEQLRTIPNKGIGFGALRYLGSEETRQALAQLPVPRITFNYLGQFDGSFAPASGAGETSALFTPAPESSGANQSPRAELGNWLSINGQVYNGELNLGWTFSRDMFAPATIQRLADDYAAELTALVAHCVDEQAQGVTPSDFPLAALDQAQLDSLSVPAGEIEDIYPLSPMQQGMLFHALYERQAGHYINQMRVDVEGLDSQRFHQAWQQAVARHDVLRASFVTRFEQPLQVIRRAVRLPFVHEDWSSQPDLAQRLDAWAIADRQAGFDLHDDPLLRIAIIRTGPDTHHVIYTSHHILMDGWSNSQLLGEVLQRYAGQAPAQTAGKYREHIQWLDRQDRQASEAFWRQQLQPVEHPTRLANALRNGNAVTTPGQGDHYHVLDATRTLALSEFARQQRVTVNTLVQAAWLLLLQRYTGQDCVTFGATVSGRPADLEGVEQQLGLFINTLPVIASPRAEQSVAAWIDQVQQLNLALREHEHTPLYDIQRWAGGAAEGLFDTLLVFENYPVSEALQKGAPAGLVFAQVKNQEQTNYPMTLALGLGATLSMHFSYARAQFDDANVRQIAVHFDHLLAGLIADGQRCVGAVP
ncbi:condensation domain-containing protein, partial [Pseudomonas sp. RIT-To-2]|uniref:condensation domain-containing protein n=1 Tax=Pseudomonas sp. RIT-To-2 TaxID=3462541 RepID=UPI002412FBD1